MRIRYKILIFLLVLMPLFLFVKGESLAYPTCGVDLVSYTYIDYRCITSATTASGACKRVTPDPQTSGDCDQFARRWLQDGANTRCGFCKTQNETCNAGVRDLNPYTGQWWYPGCTTSGTGNGNSNWNCTGNTEAFFCDAAPDGCTVNSDCPSGQQCKNPGTASSQCVDCVNNNGCSNNNTCVNNACVARYACSGTSCVKTVGGSYGGSACGGACCPTPSCSGKCGTVTNACGKSASCGGCGTTAICSNNTCVQCTSKDRKS